MDSAVLGYGTTNPEHRLMMFSAAPAATGSVIGNTATYSSNLLTQGGSFIIYTTSADGKHYALDGNGNAIEIQINTTSAIITIFLAVIFQFFMFAPY